MGRSGLRISRRAAYSGPISRSSCCRMRTASAGAQPFVDTAIVKSLWRWIEPKLKRQFSGSSTELHRTLRSSANRKMAVLSLQSAMMRKQSSRSSAANVLCCQVTCPNAASSWISGAAAGWTYVTFADASTSPRTLLATS